MVEHANIPDEALFYISDREISVPDLLYELYGRLDETSKAHFLAVNKHLDDKVRAGQMVIITPKNSAACTQWEAALTKAAMEAEAEYQKLAGEQKALLAERYALLSNVASYSGAAYGLTNSYFAQ